MAQPEQGDTDVMNSSQLLQIQSLLLNHDPDCRISRQINQRLIDDTLTLEILSQFDDKSLQEMIDSWNIDTFGKALYLIRGLMISGVKKLRNNINTNDSDKNNKLIETTVISEREMKMMKQLTNFESKITQAIAQISSKMKESKTKEKEIKNKLFEQYNNEINNTFDELINNLSKRKEYLNKKLNDIFDNNENINDRNNETMENDVNSKYLSNLQLIKQEILQRKEKYQENIVKYKRINELETRSEINCRMIESFIEKNNSLLLSFDKMDSLTTISSRYQCNINFNSEQMSNLKSIITNLGSIEAIEAIDTKRSKTNQDDNKIDDTLTQEEKEKQQERSDLARYNNNKKHTQKSKKTSDSINSLSISSISDCSLKETIISSNSIVYPNMVHKYEILRIIGENGIVTVPSWNKQTGKGGVLIICCIKLILENGASIDLNDKGCNGGNKKHRQGFSQDETGEAGGYWNNSRRAIYGNGGGYGTCGGLGRAAMWRGGKTFGDAKMFKFRVDINTNSNSVGNGINSKYSNSRDNNIYENVYLGSGGGCAAWREANSVGRSVIGTNGGGAIMIECKDSIIIGEGCNISANGGNTDGFGGCGSGGSIYLKAKKIVNNGKVTATGGRNFRPDSPQSCNGGMGRIRIDCGKQDREKYSKNNQSDKGNFEPSIEYIGLYSKNRKSSVSKFL